MEKLGQGQKIAINIIVALAIATLGVWIWIVIAQNIQEQTSLLQESTATTIAVINMDAGVTYNGIPVNFGNDFVVSLGDDMTLVSAATAEAGFENGTYGAVVTLPAHMSERVVSINAQNPASVELTFGISDNLSRDDYIEVFGRIKHAQNSLRTALSYVFVTSILEDVHLGQGQVERAIERDLADLDATFELRHTNFMTGLVLADLPDIDLDYQTFDDTELIEGSAGSFAASVSELYDQEYQEMRTAFDSAVADIGEAKEDIANWQTDQEDYHSDLTSNAFLYYTYIRDWRTSLESVVSGLDTSATSVVNSYLTQIQTFLTALNLYRTDLDTYHAELDDYRLYLEGGGASTFAGFGGTVPGSFTDIAPSITTSFTPGTIPDLPTSANTTRDYLQDLLDLPAGSIALEEYMLRLNTSITSYDPQLFFTQALRDAIERNSSSFGNEVSTLRSSLDASQSENISSLGLVHTEFFNHANQISTDVREQHDTDAENLDNSLALLLEQRQMSSEANMSSFTSIADLLPHSHEGGAVNQQVTSFIVNPLEPEQIANVGTGAQGSASFENVELGMQIVLGVLIAAALATLGTQVFVRARRVKLQKE